MSVLVDPRNKTVALPYHAGLANLVRDHHTIAHPAHGKLMVLPHTQEVTRLARNMGIKTPAPIMWHYDWNGDKPFKTQKTTAALLTMNRRAYVLSEMGTGKTRAALHAINYLIQSGDIERALIIAPLSTLTTVWENEVFRHFNHLSVGILHNPQREKRLKVLNQPHDIYVINHDGVNSIMSELIARRDIECIVVDELAAFRNARTNKWKSLSAVISNRQYVWGMTGSPTPNEPSDAWAQVKLLTPERVPKYFKSFKEATMTQVSTFRWVPRKDAIDTVFNVMQPSVRFRRDDCVELPPVVHVTREAALSAEQKKVYDRLMRELRIAFAQGEVTAANEGVLFMKLLQITAGWVYTSDKRVVALDNKPRMDSLMEILDEAEGKVIVFADFINVSKEIAKQLAAKGYSVAQVSGETSRRDRDQIFAAFQSAMAPRVLVAHPKCMAHGLTLTAASVITWFTPTTSLDTYEQACARITRPGQVRKQLIVHLTGTAVETKMYRRLQQKASLQGALLEMFEQET